MTEYSLWPVLLCLGIILLLVNTPVFAVADSPPNTLPQRLAVLDGMRGFLALFVFFYHAAMYHYFLQNRGWGYLPSRPYRLLGPLGVSLFFMITGYLFWSRLLAEQGRPRWMALYIGRIFRIAPIYLAAICGMLTFVAFGTDLHQIDSWNKIAGEIGQWLGLGVVVGPDINGFGNTALVLAGVTWTLQCEWMFYAILPFIAWATQNRWVHLPFTSAGLLLSIILSQNLPIHLIGNIIPIYDMTTLFLLGMTCASLHHARLVPRLPDWLGSIIASLLLAYVFFHYRTTYEYKPAILIGFVFYLIISGCSLFSLLKSRAARRLGDVSYGIYMLQGLALAIVFRPPPMRAIALSSPAGHWVLVCICGILLVVLATFCHVFIESPGIVLGKSLTRKLYRMPVLARIARR